jgi:type IV secretory pathway TraG/TraD family ATPase VirD4
MERDCKRGKLAISGNFSSLTIRFYFTHNLVMSYDYDSITPIGITDWRNIKNEFGIKDRDRLGHLYLIGKTGVGKSTLILQMAISDMRKGKGLAVLDPHGDLAEELLNFVPEERVKDVIYFNPDDPTPVAYNPLYEVKPAFRHLVASGLISTFKKIYSDSWGPRMEYVLKYCFLSLLDYEHATFLDIQPLLTNPEYKKIVLAKTQNQSILSFWKNEFDKMSDYMRSEVISPILNKLGVFATSIPLRNTICQKQSSFKIGEVMNGKKIFIANLSKGKIGEDATLIIGSILLNSFQLGALSRARVDSLGRTPFFLYVDEAHSFVTLSFVDMLSEARKYGLSLLMAHQYIDQLGEKIKSAIFGNVGTIISFRIGQSDAEVLAKEFYPIFNESDLIHLPKYSMYLKLMIDGAASKPFSATTKNAQHTPVSYKNECIEYSRKMYGRKPEVDNTIKISDKSLFEFIH